MAALASVHLGAVLPPAPGRDACVPSEASFSFALTWFCKSVRMAFASLVGAAVVTVAPSKRVCTKAKRMLKLVQCAVPQGME